MATIVVAQRSDTRLEAFYSDGAGHVWSSVQLQPRAHSDWNAWVPLTAPAAITAAVPVRGGGLQLFTADAATTALGGSTPGSNSVEWEPFGAPAGTSVRRLAAVGLLDGRLQAWLLTTEGRVWTRSGRSASGSATWEGWEPVPVLPITGNRFLPIADLGVARHADGMLSAWAIAAVRTPDQDFGLSGTLWWTRRPSDGVGWLGGWQRAQNVGTSFLANLRVAPLTDGRLQAWASGPLHTIWTSWQRSVAGPLGGWTTFDPSPMAAPHGLGSPYSFAAATHADGRTQVWVLGRGRNSSDDAALSRMKVGQDAGSDWTPWAPFPLPPTTLVAHRVDTRPPLSIE